eukprot:TRINITY_DN13436_c0_g1_i1.p1 TRINITY_DN13436_c0_g1~~TRINITY_DN13436_c0_g1_i1.p1  ORF type:complete len:290 (+),score=127.47 TRINITY_DN13436_c0_g1_i1:82-951(+)
MAELLEGRKKKKEFKFELKEEEKLPITLIIGRADSYHGVLIEDSSEFPSDPQIFHSHLKESIEVWRKVKRRGIWLKIPIDKSNLISIAVSLGFKFHHAKSDYLMLILWLPVDLPNTLPQYVTHYIGVGGLVMNEENKVLVIQEKNGPIKGFWKIPGGTVDSGEEIYEAAMREVFEETGIRTEFQNIVCFRQSNGHAFGMSDLFFVCRLKPLNNEIKIQESEIADARWMPLEEFSQLPYGNGVYQKILDLEVENLKRNYEGWRFDKLPIGFRKGENVLYHGYNQSLSSKI